MTHRGRDKWDKVKTVQMLRESATEELEATMFWFKECPRCSGDLYQDRDQYGSFVTCFQCGLTRDVSKLAGGPLEISAEPALAPPLPKWEGGKRRRLSHGGRHFARTFAFEEESSAESVAPR